MREYKVQGRYGYHAVDEFDERGLRRTVVTGITRKLAVTIADALMNAYQDGINDMGKLIKSGFDPS